jgi:patatin-related protein
MNTEVTAGGETTAYRALKEVRFAVVIYGGVSLAIYINGIVQELLRLVRATAPDATGLQPLANAPSGTTAVYRKLGQLLNNPDLGEEECWNRVQQKQPLAISTRFVIDVLSGTSAGGINAIFLAKALANDQDLRDLQELWIDKGDIELLINDKKSLVSRLSLQQPPQSLLNSDRMFIELLDALDGMDERESSARPALVDHLDLFSTTTDLRGLQLPITLADRIVWERRHRNVFHVEYPDTGAAAPHGTSTTGQVANPFGKDNNPFLAFAARCTSAFPFAFEPMALSDIFPILRRSQRHAHARYSDPNGKYWRRYYQDYLRDPGGAFEGRAFGDGGYLDNKPFSYAIDAMLKREADVPLERKLLYIEPNPEDTIPDAIEDGKPNALDNSMSALLTLPRMEGIRQDLERVLQRNREIERIRRVMASVRSSIKAPESGQDPAQWVNAGSAQYGGGYETYERLKLSTVTDDWADLLAMYYEVDPSSAFGIALRVLAGTWRELEYPSPQDQRRFLLQFDIGFRLRRIRHLWRTINELYSGTGIPQQNRRDFKEELLRIKQRLSAPYLQLMKLLHPALFATLDLPKEVFTAAELSLISAPPPALADYPGLAAYPNSGVRTDVGARERALYVLQDRRRKPAVTRLAEQLSAHFARVTKDASSQIEDALRSDPAHTSGARSARDLVLKSYRDYEYQDSVVFPLMFGTGLGEAEQVEIYRVSPRDSIARDAVMPKRGYKLKGHQLGAFGAFLNQEWRRNDMLWGRLDGAERLITIMLPGTDSATTAMRASLIDEAHKAIVLEFLNDSKPHDDWVELLKSFVASVPTQPEPTLVARALARSTKVAGELLEGIADQKELPGKQLFRRMAQVGRWGWYLVEVSVPRSWHEVLFNYLFQLLLLFSILLLAVALIASVPEALGIALPALGVSVGLILVRTALRRFMAGRKWLLVPPALGLLSVTLLITALLSYVVYLGRKAAGEWTVPIESSVWRASILEWLSGIVIASALVTAMCAILVGRAEWHARKQMGRARFAGLRAQFAASAADLKKIWDPHESGARHLFGRAVRLDYALAAAYGTLFSILGLQSALEGDPLGWLVAALGLFAAIANCIENTVLLRRLDMLTAGMFPRMFAIAKWTGIATAVGLLTRNYWG